MEFHVSTDLVRGPHAEGDVDDTGMRVRECDRGSGQGGPVRRADLGDRPTRAAQAGVPACCRRRSHDARPAEADRLPATRCKRSRCLGNLAPYMLRPRSGRRTGTGRCRPSRAADGGGEHRSAGPWCARTIGDSSLDPAASALTAARGRAALWSSRPRRWRWQADRTPALPRLCGAVAAERAEERVTTPVPGFARPRHRRSLRRSAARRGTARPTALHSWRDHQSPVRLSRNPDRPVLALVAHLPGNQGTRVSADPLPVR